MFLRQKKQIERLTVFRSIDIDVENLTGVAWEKVNEWLRVKPRVMFLKVKMATLEGGCIEGNLVSYAIYARDLVLFNMLRHYAEKNSFLWEFDYVAKRCQLRFDYEPYYRLALHRIQIGRQKLGIGVIDKRHEIGPCSSKQALEVVEKVLDEKLEQMQRKMPTQMLWRLCSQTTGTSPIPFFQAGRHYKNNIPSPLTENSDGKPWISGENNEYSRLINLESDVAYMLHLNELLDQQFRHAIGEFYSPHLLSKL